MIGQCEKCKGEGFHPEDTTPNALDVYCDCPLGKAFAAIGDVDECGGGAGDARSAIKEAIKAACAPIIESHDKLVKCVVAMAMAHGGAVKLHAAQLNVASAMKLEFKVTQPFLEIYVVPVKVAEPEEKGLIVLADASTKLPPPPGGYRS